MLKINWQIRSQVSGSEKCYVEVKTKPSKVVEENVGRTVIYPTHEFTQRLTLKMGWRQLWQSKITLATVIIVS